MKRTTRTTKQAAPPPKRRAIGVPTVVEPHSNISRKTEIETLRVLLEPLLDVCAHAAVGDFASDVERFDTVDATYADGALADLYTGVQVMLEATREVIGEHAQQQDLIEAIFAQMGEGLVVVDEEGAVLRANRMAHIILGLSPDMLAGRHWGEMVSTEYEDGRTVPKQERASIRAIREQQRIEADYYYVRRDGTRFPVKVVATPLAVGSEQPTSAIVLFSNVSRQKAVSRAQREFIATASHQLRTPVASAGLQLEVLLKEADRAKDLPATYRAEIAEILETQQSMMALVNKLLQVSRIELGHIPVRLVPTALHQLVEDVMQEQELLARTHGATVSADLDHELPPLPVDTELLRMVIQNLLANAIKYAAPEHGAVTVMLRSAKAGARHAGKRLRANGVLLTVTNNGAGIGQTEMPLLFRKLFRSEEALTRGIEGTGLGLYTVKSILDFSGGEIWCTSTQGEETTFLVWLPESGMRAADGSATLA